MSDPVFYQESIERHAPAVLSCLARIVNELLLMQAKGQQLPVALKVEQGNAIALIMKSTRPLECPVAPQQK